MTYLHTTCFTLSWSLILVLKLFLQFTLWFFCKFLLTKNNLLVFILMNCTFRLYSNNLRLLGLVVFLFNMLTCFVLPFLWRKLSIRFLIKMWFFVRNFSRKNNFLRLTTYLLLLLLLFSFSLLLSLSNYKFVSWNSLRYEIDVKYYKINQ